MLQSNSCNKPHYKSELCAQPRECSLTGGSPVYPRPNQPDIKGEHTWFESILYFTTGYKESGSVTALITLLCRPGRPDFKNSEKVTSNFLAGSVGVNPVIVRNVMGNLKEAGIIDIIQGKSGIALAKRLEDIAYFSEVIHTTIVATADDESLPVTAVIDMVDSDDMNPINCLHYGNCMTACPAEAVERR